MDAWEKQKSRLRFLIDLAYWTAILAIGYLGLKFLSVILPLLLAFAFAALVRPVSRFLSRETRLVRNERGEHVLVRRKFHLNRTLAGVLSVAALFLVVGGLLILLVIRLADSAADLAAALPGLYETQLLPAVTRGYNRLLEMSSRLDGAVAESLRASLPNLIASLGNAVTGLSGRAVAWLTSLAARLPQLLLTAAITSIATVFAAVDYDRIKAFVRKNLPDRPLHYLMTVRNSFVDMAGRLARSYLIIMAVTAAENVVGLWLIGVPRPVVIGLLIGVVDVFPVVGSGTVLLPWALVSLLGGDGVRAACLAALYGGVTLVRQVLEPRIVGGRVGLRPLVTVGCMYVGGKLFGGVGVFAVPVTAAILVDLNNSGILHLFRREGEPKPGAGTIHMEGIEA